MDTVEKIIKALIPEIKAQIAETVNVSKSGDQFTINTINVNFWFFSE